MAAMSQKEALSRMEDVALRRETATVLSKNAQTGEQS